MPSECFTINNDNNKTEVGGENEEKEEEKEEEDEIKIEKKQTIIQKHSGFCEIEEIDGKYYLFNNEEVNIILMLYHSLIKISKKISIYTFNIA